MEKRNIIVEKVVEFGVEIIAYCELLEEKRKYVVAKQLLKSGTSIGANVFEAQHPESNADFIHKLKVALKEASETTYWLVICERSENYPTSINLKLKVEELIRIICKIIITSKGKRNIE